MATDTTNYGLRKPATGDNVIVLTDISDNMDIIDTELKAVSDVADAAGEGAEYACTWASTGTQPALGNGTLEARWTKSGKDVTVTIRLVAGTTTTFGTGDWTFSLPVARVTHANLETVGTCLTLDVSAAQYKNDVANIASGASTMRIIGIASGSFYSNSIPHAWANTDFLNITITYEAA